MPADPPALAGLVRARFAVSPATFARMTRLPESTLAAWERADPSEPASLAPILELDRLHRALSRVVTPASIPPWLHRPNPAFDGLKPLDLIELGQIDRLWTMIHRMESGAPL